MNFLSENDDVFEKMRIFATNNLLVLRTLNLNANMISKTIDRYVWLLNTLIEEKFLNYINL